jgi:hypothetical protein
MPEPKTASNPLQGKTYTLDGENGRSGEYYQLINELADQFLRASADEEKLLALLKAVLPGAPLKIFRGPDRASLKSPSLSRRFDETLRTKEAEYHLYMQEIELVNQIYKVDFKKAAYKFALIPHCLRDFRPTCRAEPGDIQPYARAAPGSAL